MSYNPDQYSEPQSGLEPEPENNNEREESQMQEARFSFNVKFRWQGFDCQYTARDDENGGTALKTAKQVIQSLLAQGAAPNGNHQPSLTPQVPASGAPERVCPVCKKDDMLELIDLGEKYQNRQAWKCQRCLKWLPNGK